MMYKTHLAFALLVSLLLVYSMNLESKLFFVILVLISSFIPDIDNTNSKIGRKFKTSSFILNKIFSHRGFFHSLLFPLIIYFTLAFIIELKEMALAIFLGISSHLLLDMLTIDGISLFSPFSTKRIKGFIRTNSLTEKIFFVILLLLITLFIIQNLSFYISQSESLKWML